MTTAIICTAILAAMLLLPGPGPMTDSSGFDPHNRRHRELCDRARATGNE